MDYFAAVESAAQIERAQICSQRCSIPMATWATRMSATSHTGPFMGTSSTMVVVMAPSRAAVLTLRHQQPMITTLTATR